MKALIILLALGTTFQSFSQATTYDFPNPVDTKTKPIHRQVKTTYKIGSLSIDNQFDGARLNGVTYVNDSTITLRVEPENTPINFSAWYAFRTWSEKQKNVTFKITYPTGFRHRYWPKYSSNGDDWEVMSEDFVQVGSDTASVTIKLAVGKDTTWVAAQPLETSSKVQSWCKDVAESELAEFFVIGKSGDGRDLIHLKIGKGKKVVPILSRQHPPEVTGYYALKAFIDEVVSDSKLSKKFLKKYTLLVYPLMNPDGVDMGHWRHSTGGIDLNRDWAYYHQPETKQVADHIVNTVKNDGLEVVLGLDFHSTWYDVYYTTARDVETNNNEFQDAWLNYIKENLDSYEINDQPSGLGSPVSKGWFITQFGAPGVTFEIGDSTPTEFIHKKGKVAAEGMMKVLLD